MSSPSEFARRAQRPYNDLSRARRGASARQANDGSRQSGHILNKRHFALVWYVSAGSLPAAIAKGRGLAEGEGRAKGQAQPARGEPPQSGIRRKDGAERFDEKLAKPVIEESMEELDEHGVPVVARRRVSGWPGCWPPSASPAA